MKHYKRDSSGRYMPPGHGLLKKLALSTLLVSVIVGIGLQPSTAATADVPPPPIPREEYNCIQLAPKEGGYIGSFYCADDAAMGLEMKRLYDLVQSAQKEEAKTVKKAKPLSKTDAQYLSIFQGVCNTQGIKDTSCGHTLLGMARQESTLGKYMSGDNGRSHGFFHIMDYHNVPTSCSEDAKCSATWTLKRMVSYGYPKMADYAIRRHNGSATNPQTLKYLALVKAKSY